MFTISGQIENRAGSQYLPYLESARNAGVFVTKCVAGSATQTFMLAE